MPAIRKRAASLKHQAATMKKILDVEFMYSHIAPLRSWDGHLAVADAGDNNQDDTNNNGGEA